MWQCECGVIGVVGMGEGHVLPVGEQPQPGNLGNPAGRATSPPNESVDQKQEDQGRLYKRCSPLQQSAGETEV